MRAELRKLGFQRLDAGCQRRPLGLQSSHLGAQPGVLLAQRRDHARGPCGRRPQPVVALVQPRDGAIPGLHQPRGRRAPTVELLAQRRNLAVVPVRRLAERLPQPADVLLQPIDLVAMPGLDPLLVGVGPPQPAAEIVDLAFQELDPAFLALRRAADFLGLLLGSPQLVSAGVELGLQRTRPGTRGHLCPAQFFTARFRRLRTRPFPLVQRPPVARRADAVCEGDQIPSSPSASVRSAPKSSPRIDMRSTVAHGRIRYQHQISGEPAIPRPPNSYISIEPLFAEAHRNLAIARRHVEVDEDVRRTRRLMDIEMNEVATMHAEFALAKIDDDLGEIDDAFTHLSRAN